jgi:hypothetical protein
VQQWVAGSTRINVAARKLALGDLSMSALGEKPQSEDKISALADIGGAVGS